VWKAHAEGKHKFFSWLLVQSKILTADKLAARNWPCNPVCALCDQDLQDAAHLCLHCVFTREVWAQMCLWTGGVIKVPEASVGLEEWWHRSLC
jgi:hypothetical protein